MNLIAWFSSWKPSVTKRPDIRAFVENRPDDARIWSFALPSEISNFLPNSTLHRRMFMINTTSANDFDFKLYTDSSPAQEVKTQQGREITDIYIL